MQLAIAVQPSGAASSQHAAGADACKPLPHLPPAGLQPVLVHLSKNDKGKFSFNPVAVNLMTELAKTLFALAVLLTLVSRAGRQQLASCAAALSGLQAVLTHG